MITKISTLEEFNSAKENDAALFYFSHEECNVCKVLKPKLQELIEENFSKIKMFYVNIKESPELAAQNSVFTVPTITVMLDGREFIRKSRNLNIPEFTAELERPYQMMFE